MSDDNTVDILLAARDVYAAQGGGIGPEAAESAPYCALGALRFVTGSPRTYITARIARLLYPDDQALTEFGAGHDALVAALPVDLIGVDIYNDRQPTAVRKERILDLYDNAIRYAKDQDGAL